MTNNDYDSVHALWLSTPNMGLNDIDDSREGIEKYLRRNPTSCFVAESDNEITGVIISGHDGRRGFIYHMAVKESCQRQGIGTRLLSHALNALKEEGITKVVLAVFEKNIKGNSFWEKQGFYSRNDLVYRNKALTELKRIDT
jgi:ribosomal protein S18 acetylase RimI-like enzyme